MQPRASPASADKPVHCAHLPSAIVNGPAKNPPETSRGEAKDSDAHQAARRLISLLRRSGRFVRLFRPAGAAQLGDRRAGIIAAVSWNHDDLILREDRHDQKG